MFQLPPQIVFGCSNSKWYLNLVFHPLNTSCKNQEPTRHEHNVTAFYTKLEISLKVINTPAPQYFLTV